MKVNKKFYVNFDVKQFQQSLFSSKIVVSLLHSLSFHSFI